MTSASISVIIPSYNMARFLPDAITSVRRQARTVAEILVVDPSSTDDTVAVVADLARQGAPVRRIGTKPTGPAAARNVGLAKARGELIAFLDADDLWPADKLYHQCARLDRMPRVDMVSGHVQFFDRLDPIALAPAETSRTSTIFHVYVGACLFRRKVFDDIGRFDERLRYCEDIDLMERLRERAIPFTILREITLFYRRHADAMMASRNPRQAADFRRAQALSRARRNALGKEQLPAFETFLEPCSESCPGGSRLR